MLIVKECSNMGLSDEEIVHLVLTGNKDAYEELVQRYQKRIYTLSCKMGCNSEDAKGITQTVFLQAFVSLPNFQQKAKFSSWLYTLTANRCRNWLRYLQVRVLPLPGYSVHNITKTPEEQYLEIEKTVELEKALRSLPDKYRAVLILFYYKNWSYEDIANTLHLSIRAVETRLYRARHFLRKATQEDRGEA